MARLLPLLVPGILLLAAVIYRLVRYRGNLEATKHTLRLGAWGFAVYAVMIVILHWLK